MSNDYRGKIGILSDNNNSSTVLEYSEYALWDIMHLEVKGNRFEVRYESDMSTTKQKIGKGYRRG